MYWIYFFLCDLSFKLAKFENFTTNVIVTLVRRKDNLFTLVVFVIKSFY